MKINILVTGGIYSTQAGYSALKFCQAALTQGHEISQVFFYQDAVTQSSLLAVPLDDEFHAYEQWETLAQQHSIKLLVCVSAAERRGVLGKAQALEYDKPAVNLSPEFEIAGLGVLHQAALESERMVTFK